MYIDRQTIEEYPFDGVFYTSIIDESKPLDEQKEEDVVVLATKCDIQEAQKQLTGVYTASFTVYFPLDKGVGTNIQRGMKFRGDFYGLEVNGIVGSVIPSQMGGCMAYIVDKDV